MVMDNYWENRWWPLSVDDWRLRMLFAGLSTRVSYQSIKTYQSVRNRLAKLGFEQLSLLSEDAFKSLVHPLGLSKTRWDYWQSVKEFSFKYSDTKQEPHELRKLSNDVFIELIKNQIHGAGYKVAQCCVLYIRGYHCGVIPIDSGLKDLLGPCLGFNTKKSAIGNEIMRKHVEELAKGLDFQALWKKTGYPVIANSWKRNLVNTWWVHLVLIYFKRRFCNLKNASNCPLVSENLLGKTMKFSCMK
jgi:hypothetical protein